MVYTVEEVAERLRIHPQTVRRLIASGRLGATDVAVSNGPWQARYRISEEQVLEFLARKSRRPKAKANNTGKPGKPGKRSE